VRLIGPWLLVILTASQSFTAIGVLITVIGGAVLAWLQALELGRETRARVERAVNDLQAPIIEQRARRADATFEPVDGPQAGRVISIDDDPRG
jgi:hypothetical protein